MSALIKSPDARDCMSLRDAHGAARSTPAESMPAYEKEIARLCEEVATLRAAQDHSAERVASARRDGVSEGRALALAEISESRADALDRLEAACNRAIEHFTVNLASAERLAIFIAQAVLERMLLDQPHFREVAGQAIAARVRDIENSSVVRLLVSPADFPEPEELDQLADLCGVDLAVIRQSADLDAGQCRVELTLGVLDIGLRQQWERLNQHLLHALHAGDSR